MSNELFKESEVSLKSPRLRWMERHGVETKEDCDREADEYKWMAWNPEKGDPADEEELGYMIAEAHVCFGQTEDEAVANWACEHKIKLWNEE